MRPPLLWTPEGTIQVPEARGRGIVSNVDHRCVRVHIHAAFMRIRGTETDSDHFSYDIIKLGGSSK